MDGQKPARAVDSVTELREQWTTRFGFRGSVERIALAEALEQASRVVHARIEEVLKPFDLSRSRYAVLFRLAYWEGGSQQLGRLSGHLLVHPTSVTGLVDRLEKSGLVERSFERDDRRVVQATITPRGRAVVEEAAKALAEAEFGLAHVSVTDSVRLLQLLLKVLTEPESSNSTDSLG